MSRAAGGYGRTVADSTNARVSEDAVFVVVRQVACLLKEPLRETVGKGLVVDGLDVHVVVDLGQT